ncbi:MAG: exopolyphosphatase [Cytophagaceae bacterium]|nr:exopolyphosphatase [Cytophagaceae bacterium]
MEKTRVAIIDLGTNTFNLLVAEVNGSSYRILAESKYPVKLGKGGINKAIITEEAMERGIEALDSHLITTSEYNVAGIFCFATSAIRSATNGNSFVQRVKQKLGLPIRIIPGDEEAETIFDGVKQVIPMANDPVLIMDIGGGSIEFIIANKTGVLWKDSYNLGVARLLEQFTPSDPIRVSEISTIEKHLKSQLGTLFEAVKRFPVKLLVGTSGSVDTLASIVCKERYPLLDINKITSLYIELDGLEEAHNLLLSLNIDGRRVVPGMDPDRVDTIVLASIIVQWVLKELKIQALAMCAFALKEGAILQIIQSEF